MAALGRRLRARFPALFGRPYLARRYNLVSTRVARAAQSASAFSLGLFERAGGRAPGAAAGEDGGGGGGDEDGCGGCDRCCGVQRTAPQPVALTMLPKQGDRALRFFDACPAYAAHKRAAKRRLARRQARRLARAAPGVERRLGLPRGTLRPCHVDGEGGERGRGELVPPLSALLYLLQTTHKTPHMRTRHPP